MFSFGIFGTHIPYLVMIFLFVCSISFPVSSDAVDKKTTAKCRWGTVGYVVENYSDDYNYNIDFEIHTEGDVVYSLKFLALKFPTHEKYALEFGEKQISKEISYSFFERPPPKSLV